MAGTFKTIDHVTRAALAVLHQKSNFIGSINKQYDSSFAQQGAKIGDTLRIRLPNEYSTGTGATATFEATTERNTTLQVATQRWVAMDFTSAEMALSVDDFTDRIIDPAMTRLAAAIEADALSMHKQVYQHVANLGAAGTYAKVLAGRKVLNDSLAPQGGRIALLDTQSTVDIVTDTKTLFNDQAQLAKQYKEGYMGRAAGFDFSENTLIPAQTTGTALASTTYTVNGAITTNGTAAVTVAVGATTFKIGDIFTVAGCFRVHPESKVSTGDLQPFVVTADYGGGAGSLSFSPAVYTSGASQNVVAAGMANGAAITKIGGASAVYKPSILFHPDAFTFATADLVMPKGVDMASRQVMDGISLRLVRAYDVTTDRMLTRVDCLYGYKCIRPELAVRLLNN